MAPLILVYDHRVIDGVAGARFISHLRTSLSRPESLLDAMLLPAPAAASAAREAHGA
jgi:hypothetical protein